METLKRIDDIQKPDERNLYWADKERDPDGEIVCLDGEGRSQSNELLHRRGNSLFYAFDLLWLDGRDLRQLPLVQRKVRLRKLIDRAKSPAIIYAQHIEASGAALYQETCSRDLEGIVCKRNRAFLTNHNTQVGWEGVILAFQ